MDWKLYLGKFFDLITNNSLAILPEQFEESIEIKNKIHEKVVSNLINP